MPSPGIGDDGFSCHPSEVGAHGLGGPANGETCPLTDANILIKLMSMVAVVFAGVIVKYAPQIGDWLGIGG